MLLLKNAEIENGYKTGFWFQYFFDVIRQKKLYNVRKLLYDVINVNVSMYLNDWQVAKLLSDEITI